MRPELLAQLQADRAAKRPVVLATKIRAGGDEVLVHPTDSQVPAGWPANLLEAARDALRADKSGSIESDDGPIFLNVFNPPLRMIIVGAVHISQALAPMAVLAGFDVFVVDPRRSFATAERFPGVTLVDEWPDEAMARLAPDGRTALVTVTHDPKLDDPALDAGLKSECFYIGALGSRKTHGARLFRLKKYRGWDEDVASARIKGPVGLNIGAKSPAEIAVSIIAEVISYLRLGPPAKAEAPASKSEAERAPA